jgi:hypothetical protein
MAIVPKASPSVAVPAVPVSDAPRLAKVPGVPDLLNQASAILARESVRLPKRLPKNAFAPDGAALPADIPLPTQVVTNAPIRQEAVRDRAHELIDALLQTLREDASEKPARYENMVPLIRAAAPVQAGQRVCVGMHVTNEEAAPVDVSLYCTDFVTDSGYPIPSLSVTVSPRRVTIASRARAEFEVSIAVPARAPAGEYSGLVQAMGSRYVKAVLAFEVL